LQKEIEASGKTDNLKTIVGMLLKKEKTDERKSTIPAIDSTDSSEKKQSPGKGKSATASSAVCSYQLCFTFLTHERVLALSQFVCDL